MFDTSDEEQTRAAFDVSKALVPKAAELGYGEYRAHIDFMDLCAQAYDFNDYAGRRLAETIKDALDPNGILMPGKQGIWPKRMRDAEWPGATTSSVSYTCRRRSARAGTACPRTYCSKCADVPCASSAASSS